MFLWVAIGRVPSRDFLSKESVLGRLWSQKFQLDNFRHLTRKAGAGGGGGGGGGMDPVVLLAFRI